MRSFNKYQEFTASLAVYNTDIKASLSAQRREMFGATPLEPMPYIYPVMALAEEAGEVAGKVAKYIRKQDNDFPALREAVGKELGDVAYQLSECARQFGFTLQQIIDMNVAKLSDRKDRGVLVGEGDDR